MPLNDLLDQTTSPLVVPSVYFDTQVLSLAARRRICDHDWQVVVAYIKRNAQHCVSLTTMYELFAGAATGDESRFAEYRDAFSALRISPHQTYLPLVRDFVRSRLFNLPISRVDFGPDELSKWIDIVVRSASRTELLKGLVELDRSGAQTYGFRLRKVQCQILRGKAQYIRRLRVLRAQARKPDDIEPWASRMVHQLQLPLTKANKQTVEKALEPVYRHDASVRGKSLTNRNFNFKKHASSWLDSNQLFYLADPNFIFVTADAKLIRELAGSAQAKRVILFDQLLNIATGD
jgi:hypothetical protein